MIPYITLQEKEEQFSQSRSTAQVRSIRGGKERGCVCVCVGGGSQPFERFPTHA